MKKIKMHTSFNRIVWLLFFSPALFIGCVSAPGNKETVKTTVDSINVSRPLSKPASSFNDTLTITVASAVFYNPDSTQLERIKSLNTKMVYESMVHDCFYQMRNARMVLKQYWPKVKLIETSSARYLLFIKSDKTRQCIDLNSKNDMCGIFLFSPLKDPELVDMMNIDTALGFYFMQ